MARVTYISGDIITAAVANEWYQRSEDSLLGDMDADGNTIIDPALSGVSRVGLAASTELTIASGAITVTQTYHTVDTEGDAASDDLATINGGAAHDLLILRQANDARDVTIKHGTGNIKTFDGSDTVMDSSSSVIVLVSDGTNWHVLGIQGVKRSGDSMIANAAGTGNGLLILNPDTDTASFSYLRLASGASADVWQVFARNGSLFIGIDDLADYIEIPSGGAMEINGNTVWHAGNFPKPMATTNDLSDIDTYTASADATDAGQPDIVLLDISGAGQLLGGDVIGLNVGTAKITIDGGTTINLSTLNIGNDMNRAILPPVEFSTSLKVQWVNAVTSPYSASGIAYVKQ